MSVPATIPIAGPTRRRDNLKRLGGNVVALFASVCVATAVLEAGARVLANALDLSSYMKYDELLGWTAKPGARRVHRDDRLGFNVTYLINEQGFRGTSYAREKPVNMHRLVVLGDSNGFGWGMAEDEHFASLLDRELPRVQVINLSLSGYGTDQQYLRFVREGIQFDPDVVVLQVTPNDFDEIQYSFYNRKPKPQFVLTGSGLTLRNVPPKSDGTKSQEYYDYSMPFPFKEWLGWNSYAYNALNQKYYSMRRRLVSGQNATDVNRPRFSRESFQLFNAITALLKQRLDDIGARGLIVHAAKELSEHSAALVPNLPIIDLSSRFASSRNPWLGDGYHFNAVGHRIVADEIVHAIRRLGYLPGQ